MVTVLQNAPNHAELMAAFNTAAVRFEGQFTFVFIDETDAGYACRNPCN